VKGLCELGHDMAAAAEIQPTDRRQEHAEADWRRKYNPWLITMVVAMAASTQVLDTSIAMRNKVLS
jgi:hypothetical protein